MLNWKSLSVDSRVIWGLLLAFVAIAPFLPLTGLPIAWGSITLMDWQRLFEAAVLFIAIAWALVAAPPLSIKATPILYGWCLFFALGLASTLFAAQHTLFALLDWSWLLLIMTLLTFMHHWRLHNPTPLDHLILSFVLVSSIVYLWWFWKLNAFIYFSAAPEGVYRVINFPGFSNVRFFSDFQSFILLLLPLSIYRLTQPGLGRTLALWMGGLYFALALIAASRSLVTAHVILHSTMLLYLGKRYWPFLSIQLRFWCYGAAYYFFLTWLMPLLLSSSDYGLTVSPLLHTDSSGRSVLWKMAIDLISDHPWLGIGPMHFANHANFFAASTHNVPLQMAVEWGLPAGILFTLLVGFHAYRRVQTIRFIDNLNDSVSFSVVCAGIAILLQSMVACSPLGYPTGQVLAMLCFVYPLQAHPATSHAIISVRRNIAIRSAGWMALLLTISSMTTIPSIMERNSCYRLYPWPTMLYAPHFWQQGWLVGPCGDGDSLLSQLVRLVK